MERLLKKNGMKETNISAAGGPCLAKNLANKAHTSVVFANKDIKMNDKITEKDLKFDSPQRDISVDFKNIFINSYANKKIKKGDSLGFDHVKLLKKKK